MRYERELYHHGIKGQKWGIRRFQNPDGSLTSAGKKHRNESEIKPNRKTLNDSLDERTVLSTKNRDGTEITLEQLERPALAKLLAKGSEHIREQQYDFKDFDIKVDGKKIGNLEINQESPYEINGVWLGINDKYRGNGYATASLLCAIDFAKQKGYKEFSLEVPGHSPDARHIYEKIGFVAGEKVSDDDDIWGGLTKMRLDLTKK